VSTDQLIAGAGTRTPISGVRFGNTGISSMAHRTLCEARTEREGCRSGRVRAADPSLQGEMTITFALADAGGGTDIFAVHDGLPPGVPPADNEAGWRSSLAKLAALVEAG